MQLIRSSFFITFSKLLFCIVIYLCKLFYFLLTKPIHVISKTYWKQDLIKKNALASSEIENRRPKHRTRKKDVQQYQLFELNPCFGHI